MVGRADAGMAFTIEEIPDSDALLHHVPHQMWVAAEERPSSACFKKKPSLSVNWIRYSSVTHTRREKSFAVISLLAGGCRSIGQEVQHSPIEADEPFGPNQAHTDILGEKPQPVADQLARLARVEWIKARIIRAI